MKTDDEVLQAIQTMFQEISNLKKDVSYLSGKVGLHDMYLNRINKERERDEKAEDLFAKVKTLVNGERRRFLVMMYNEYFSKGDPIKESDIEY